VPELSASAQRVQEALRAAGVDVEVRELAASTRTAAEAASSVGCTVPEIAKSLVFRGTVSGDPILVIASGANRVDEARVAGIVGEPIERASAEFVRDATGYAIGGVPPAGHRTAIRTLIDEDLTTLEHIWAAAGTPNAVCRLRVDELVRVTGGTVAAIRVSVTGHDAH